MIDQEFNEIKKRRMVSAVICIVLFFGLFCRFFYVQVIGEEEYSLQSDENSTRQVIEYPIRGHIYDRNKNMLVDNKPAYYISVIPYEMKDKDKFYSFISENFPEDYDRVVNKIKQVQAPYNKTKILQVDYDKLTVFEENMADLQGVMAQIEPQRTYTSGIRASHFLGYIKEIDEDEIKTLGPEFYQSGDIVGKKGLEKKYEEYLRGEKGVKFLEVNAYGQIVQEIFDEDSKAPVRGNNLILTLDLEMQKLTEELMKDHSGAVIALNPQNGEIYTAVSKPDWDLSIMSGHMSEEQYDDLFNNPLTNYPLYNRATQGAYPPGSTFKLIGAIAALNDSIHTMDQEYTCNGSFRIGRGYKYCWNKGGHGKLNMLQAIEQSCNVYFYNLARDLTIDNWAHYAGLFHFGEKTGVDIPEDSPGSLPTREYMDLTDGVGVWHEFGTMVNHIIGQGALLTSPLQMVRFTAAIGTKGKIIQPHFLLRIEDSYTDSVISVPEFEISYIESINDEVWDIIREGMRLVVNGEKGTAKSTRMKDVVVSGKTGTAQNAGEDHAWYIGYAPADNPSIAIAVFIENGGGGSRVAAPIAGQIIKKHFSLQKDRANNILSSGSR